VGKSFVQKTAEKMAQLENQSRNTTVSSRLDYASLEDTWLEMFDRFGVSKGGFGKQPDGSFGGLVRDSPAQPTPTAPLLAAGDLGAVEVTWDGGTTDFPTWEVHGHTEVLSVFSEDGSEPEESEYHLASTIRDRQGGATTIICPTPGTWFVRLRLVGQDRTTKGEMSAASSVEIVSLVDTDAIREALEEAQKRIDESTAAWQSAKAELEAALAGLNVDTLPGLAQELAENEQRVEDARERLSSVETEIRINVDDLAARIATVIQLHAGSITAGQIGVDRINVNEFFGNTAVLNLLRAAVVQALEITAEVGFIGGALLKDGTIDVPKLNVTEEMVAEFAQILHLVADKVEMNEFIAMSGMIGYLEAIGITLSNTGQGRRTEVSGQGLQVFDTTTSNLMIQLGNFTGGDLLSLYDSETGDPTVTITGAGGLSVMHLNSQWDPTIGGKPLMGDLFESPQAAASESILETVSLGASGVMVRPFTGAVGASPQGIGFIEKKVKPGRSYRIEIPDFLMGDRQDYYLSCYYTTSANPEVRPALPTSNTALLGTVAGVVPPSGLGWPTTSLSFRKVFIPTTERWIRVQIVVGRYGGGSVTFGSSNSIATNPRALIEDLGPRTGDGGRVSWRNPASTTESAAPADLVTLPYSVTQTATYTWNPSTGTATRQGIDVEPRFGYWPNGLYYLTLVQFAPWNQGGSLVNVDINVTPQRWATSAGQVVQSGLVSMTGAPPASFDASTASTRLDDLFGVGAGSTRQLPLEEMHAQMQGSQARAAILLGWQGWAGGAQNNQAAGVLRRDKTFARLHTTTATADGQGTSDG